MSLLKEADKEIDLDFKWGMKRVGKNTHGQIYESFTYDGLEYSLFDCVYMWRNDQREPDIGKIVQIWETSRCEKKVKVLWFFRPSDICECLGDDKPSENEIFLASGEGKGLANDNSLLAIAGKCNVVCISKDKRNPQPSDAELRTADFIFYRTFDVRTCMLSDKFPDKIADFQVGCYFNRKKDQKLVSDSKSKSNLKERAEKGSLLSSGVASPENQHSKKRRLLGSFNENKSKITDKSSCQLAKDKNVKLENQDSEVSRQTKNGCRDNLTKLSDSHLRLPDRKGEAFDSKAISSRSKGLLEEVSFRENASKITDKLSLQLVKDAKVKLENQVSEVSRWTENGSRDNLTKLSDYRKKLPDSKGETFGAKAISSGSKGLLKGVNFHENASKITNKSGSQLAKDEKVKLDNQVSEISRRTDGSRDDLMKLSAHCQSDCKGEPLDAAFDAKAISSGSKGLPKGVSSRENAGKNTDKTTSQLVNDKEVKPDDKPFEVTRRPHADKKRWFKPLSLEERLKRADDQGTLVFLENLDPSYTSADVKDILRHALNEEVDSKMIERSAFSSPHNGQAFVIFKSKDAAKGALRKLDERCLMLPNGRPLVADVITPTLREPGKTVKFVGHLEIDNARLRKAREEMPNTIEYDLAMEWCMLQEKSNGWWNALHKKQAKEIEQLMSQLKCAHKE